MLSADGLGRARFGAHRALSAADPHHLDPGGNRGVLPGRYRRRARRHLLHRPGLSLRGRHEAGLTGAQIGEGAPNRADVLGSSSGSAATEGAMAKAYWVAAYRSISNPDALAAYAKLAGPAIQS